MLRNDPAEDPVLRLDREEIERLRAQPPEQPRPPERPTIPATQLPAAAPDSPLRTEWDLYRRVVGQLLAEGHEGKWLLIKNEEIVGIWDKEAEADAVRLERFLAQPVLLKQILARETVPVMELPPGPACDVLVGMDVVRQCKLIVDGPGGFFTLEFGAPRERTRGEIPLLSFKLWYGVVNRGTGRASCDSQGGSRRAILAG